MELDNKIFDKHYTYPEIRIERDGKFIELTDQEKSNIFYEMERHYYKEDIVNELSFDLEEDFEEGKRKELYINTLMDDKLMNRLLDIYEEYRGNDECWHTHLMYALGDFVEENIK